MDWEITTLAESGKWYSGGTPRTDNPEFWSGEIPWISAASMHNFFIDKSDRCVTPLGVENGTRLVPKDTIIFVVRGMSLQNEFRIGITRTSVTFGQDCKALVANERFIPLFLAYYLRSQEYDILGLVDEASHGTGKLPTEAIAALEVPVPPLAEQRAIAGVLSSLDDKIDLLHRQNKTLESLAETVFRQWFIEEAQDDWEEGRLGDLIELQRGFDLPVQSRMDGEFPIYAASGYAGKHFEHKAGLPGVVTGRSGLLGKVYYVQENFWPLNTTLFVKHFKRATPLFAYFLLREIDLASFNAGSAVPTLNRNHVHAIPLRLPPPDRIEQFESSMTLSFQKMHSNQIQIRTLQDLRDELLRKFMTGEIRASK